MKEPSFCLEIHEKKSCSKTHPFVAPYFCCLRHPRYIAATTKHQTLQVFQGVQATFPVLSVRSRDFFVFAMEILMGFFFGIRKKWLLKPNMTG